MRLTPPWPRVTRLDTLLNYCLRSGHDSSVDCLAWHPNCNYILSGSADKTVRMWNYTDQQCVRLFQAGRGAVTAVAFSPDGKLAASAGEDRVVRVWDLAGGGALAELRGHGAAVVQLVWCRDSRLLVAGAGDGAVRVWDTVTQDTAATLSCGPATAVTGASFTSTNTLLVTATES